MTGLPPGRCRSCDAALSYFARTCPGCGAPNLPNPVATIAALVVVVLLGGLIALGALAIRGRSAPQAPPQAAGAPSAPDRAAGAADDYGWIVKAMAECEEEAKQKQDTLHFLIVPVTTTGMSLPGFSIDPIGSVGNSAALLTSTDTLLGLRNRVLVLFPKPLTFAVSDPATQTVYKWKPAAGVSALKTRESGMANLTLGFEIPDRGKEIEWGPTIKLEKGTCYWVNPLVLPLGRGG